MVNTNVLRTEVSCGDGRFEIFDYAPRIPAGLDAEAPLEIHRLILPRDGAARVRVLFDPKPDYARVQKPKIVPVDGGLEIGDEPAHLHLCTNIPLPYLESGQALRIDEPRYFVLSYGRRSPMESVASVQRALHLTIAGWRAWAKSSARSVAWPATFRAGATPCLQRS